MSVRVYLALTTGSDSEDEDDDRDPADIDVPMFSSKYRKFQLYTHARIDHLPFNLGKDAFERAHGHSSGPRTLTAHGQNLGFCPDNPWQELHGLSRTQPLSPVPHAALALPSPAIPSSHHVPAPCPAFGAKPGHMPTVATPARSRYPTTGVSWQGTPALVLAASPARFRRKLRPARLQHPPAHPARNRRAPAEQAAHAAPPPLSAFLPRSPHPAPLSAGPHACPRHPRRSQCSVRRIGVKVEPARSACRARATDCLKASTRRVNVQPTSLSAARQAAAGGRHGECVPVRSL
ncbi:hypothetical protein GGX14DRAFT_393665 [Mycena pura]|uniref:Uncharacterized protein n=1 Tax=Mycena pura TaxID=153505 RepID=A0AAD6VJN1_9AGAR|nr:hypothetical protein GGX14DRAFT_393665 [Mycena pura]